MRFGLPVFIVQIFALSHRFPRTVLDPTAAVLRVAALVPQLDPRTLYAGHSRSGALSFAAVSHSPEQATPRRYRAQRGDTVVLFDGRPIDRLGALQALDASVLLNHWEVLPERLEGIFNALRIDLAGDRVECLLDVMGMAQVFMCRRGAGWVLGNSVEAIIGIAGAATPDPVGVSSMLASGWASGGHSLVEAVGVLPGGHLHRFDGRGWSARPLLTPALVAPRAQTNERRSSPDLAEAMARTTRAAAEDLAPLTCGLTAGRDTRVLVALLVALGLGADYYTSGHRGDVDVEIAELIVDRFGLPFQVVEPTLPRDEDEWARLTTRFVHQTDGLASLWGVADWVDHEKRVERIGLKLWGPGGEIGRAGNIGLAIPFVANVWGLRRSVRAQRLVLRRKTSGFDGLLTAEAVELARRSLEQFVAERLEEGWRPREVLEAFYAFERVRHWAAAGVRRASRTTDLHSPFISRDFITYCFSLSPGERFVEAAHRRILSELSPVLRDLPYEKPWRAQRPRAAPAMAAAQVGALALHRIRRAASAPGRRAAESDSSVPRPVSFAPDWFEAGLHRHREVCLSFPNSPLWELIDRGHYERALAGPAEARSAQMEGLCRALTALWYFHGPGGTSPTCWPRAA